MNPSEIFDVGGTAASGATLLCSHCLQPAPLTLEVPARDVQHRGAHLGRARGAGDGGGGNLLARLLCLHVLSSQHICFRVNVVQLLPTAALLPVAASSTAAVADAVPDVDVGLPLFLHAISALLPRHLCPDPLPSLAANPFKPLPPVLQVARRGGGEGDGLVGGG